MASDDTPRPDAVDADPNTFEAVDTSDWNPDLCGPINLSIDGEGEWHYSGEPIDRSALVRLFASVLRLESDGAYYLVTPYEKVQIAVADVPFRVDAMGVTNPGPDQSIEFETQAGESVVLDEGHPLTWMERTPGFGRRPYLRVRDNLDALLSRAVYYRLVELANEHDVDGEPRFGVWSRASFFPLD